MIRLLLLLVAFCEATVISSRTINFSDLPKEYFEEFIVHNPGLWLDSDRYGKWEIIMPQKQSYGDAFLDGKNMCFSLEALTGRQLNVRNEENTSFEPVYLCLKKRLFRREWMPYFRTKPK